MSSIIPRCFCFCSLINYTVKAQQGVRVFVYFLLKITSLSLFTWIWIEPHFPLYPQGLILANVFLSSAAELSLLRTTKIKEVSSLNNLVLDNNLSAKSFMHIKKIVVLVLLVRLLS